MGALKYFILKVDPKKRMLFNPAESIDFNGNTGPFIQYTYARIRSVLRKGESSFHNSNGDHQYSKAFTNAERNLVKLIYQYPNTVREASAGLSPAMIANYVYELAKSFNHFYHDHIIVDDQEKETSQFRLQLSDLISQIIHQGMKLLGIEVPEKM